MLRTRSTYAPHKPTPLSSTRQFFVDDLGYGDTGFNGHPTTQTPNIDALAHNGKVLSSWYSGCPVCSGSRAALMTGRQYNRVGVPGVFGPGSTTGLPLNETTVAAQLKKKDYATAIMGKWHLGQRAMFLPGARGFDEYLGIPYSDDMGEARATPCTPGNIPQDISRTPVDRDDMTAMYEKAGFYDAAEQGVVHDGRVSDPGTGLLPLVYQVNGSTSVLEQPLDFTNLPLHYNKFATGFIERNAHKPFFLYMPFSHVHTTAGDQPEMQYAGCMWKNATRRGMFGDALAEVDWIIGNVVAELEKQGVANNTLILFTGDNGPWMVRGKSGGSPGLFYGRTAGYWNTGKGSTWEGGIHEAGFAHWPGMIAPATRTFEVVSSMDLFPTASALAGIPLPTDRVYDGKDMTDVLLGKGPSKHEFLFFYGGGGCSNGGPSAVRFGQYKAHWCTAPGLGGCQDEGGKSCPKLSFKTKGLKGGAARLVPLMFNIGEDPSEAYPLNLAGWKAANAGINTLDTTVDCSDESLTSDDATACEAIMAAYEVELKTFTKGKLVAPPKLPSEAGGVAVCCDRSKQCDCDGAPTFLAGKMDDVPAHAAAQWFAASQSLPSV